MIKYMLLYDKNSTIVKFDDNNISQNHLEDDVYITDMYIYDNSKWIKNIEMECILSKMIKFGLVEKFGKFLTQNDLKEELQNRKQKIKSNSDITR